MESTPSYVIEVVEILIIAPPYKVTETVLMGFESRLCKFVRAML